MVAQEKGLLQFDDDVSALVAASGGFSINNPESRAITLRHLATHTSGIIDNDDKYTCAYYVNNDDGSQTKLANLFDVGISCPEHVPNTLPGFLAAYLDATGEYYESAVNYSASIPGETFEYSNIGAGLAGYTLELATGQTLAEFAMAEIFIPLGMPDGGLRSSAADMARLLATIMNNGTFGQSAASILQPASVTQMLTPVTDDCGLFWEVKGLPGCGSEQNPCSGHTGSDPGAFILIYFNSELDVGIVMVATGDDDEIDDQAFLDLFKLLFESGELLQ